MRIFIALCAVIGLSLTGCETTKNAAPSTAGVKSKINQASNSVDFAKQASERSSQHIRSFKSDADRIDYKASKALELL